MDSQFGIFLTSLVVFHLSISLPLAFLFVLYAIYKKLKNIDEQLKKPKNDK